MSFLFNRGGDGRRAAAREEEERRERREAVDKLCNRLSHASLLEDRRSAAMALKSISKHFQVEIGATALPILVEALERDFEDADLVKSIIETFISVCSEDVEMHVEFSEILLKDNRTVKLLLEALEDKSQYIRFDVLQLLSLVESHLPKTMPKAILAAPSGLSRLLDLLDDERDIIRNEAILLLQRLTRQSLEIQKIAVFEGTFERLLELVFNENGVFGGEVIVEDALIIMKNLLDHNPPNQVKYYLYLHLLIHRTIFVNPHVLKSCPC